MCCSHQLIFYIVLFIFIKGYIWKNPVVSICSIPLTSSHKFANVFVCLSISESAQLKSIPHGCDVTSVCSWVWFRHTWLEYHTYFFPQKYPLGRIQQPPKAQGQSIPGIACQSWIPRLSPWPKYGKGCCGWEVSSNFGCDRSCGEPQCPGGSGGAS